MNAKNIHLVLCAVCVPCLPSLAIPESPRWTHGFEVVCWHAKAAAIALQESRKHYSIILRRTSQKVALCLEPQSGLKDIGLLKKIIQGIPRYSNAILKWTEKGRIKSNKGGSLLWGSISTLMAHALLLHADIRVIAAANADFNQLVLSGKFREDLF